MVVLLHIGGAGLDDLIGALGACVAGFAAIYFATHGSSSDDPAADEGDELSPQERQ
jgi:hypothetical protein